MLLYVDLQFIYKVWELVSDNYRVRALSSLFEPSYEGPDFVLVFPDLFHYEDKIWVETEFALKRLVVRHHVV